MSVKCGPSQVRWTAQVSTDDVLRVAVGLDRFELLDGIDSDKALGGYLVGHG